MTLALRPGGRVPLAELIEALARHGLRVRGGFATDGAMDAELLRVAPWARTLILIGNAGSELWDKSGAEIATLDDPDPLDRWTRNVIEPIAASVDGLALFPFAGPPYWPFQRWAERAEGVRQSPIGIQIHPEFGLWHAYRAAILLRDAIALPRREQAHPCDACVDRPCLTHCPVNAFTSAGYAVDRCVDHVVALQNESGSCSQVGCLARLACPVGTAWRYHPEHARFHMRAFVKARMRSKVNPSLTNSTDDVVRTKA
ncbi:MAG TPA: ferredoxin [Dongiaceae bacterium]|nr:ferredoxin [Dongiaceae bacterium]